MTPEPALLTRRQTESGDCRSALRSGWGSLRILCVGRIFRSCRLLTAFLLRRRGARLKSARDFLAEKRFGVTHERRFHVGEHAVEIECDAKGHLGAGRVQADKRAAEIGRRPTSA